MKIIRDYILKSSRKRLQRKVTVFNLKTAKTALIVYDATETEFDKSVRNFARFLKEEGIKTDTVGLFKKKNKNDELPQDELGYSYFEKGDLNWLGFPNSTKLKRITARDYHLLIDLNLKENFPLQVISSLSKANFKVGKGNGYQLGVCDFTIASKNESVDYLIEQLKLYLKMINN